MLRFATAFFLLSPALAAAQCITAESLDTGITVEYGNGNVSHIQRQADGSLLDAYVDLDGYYTGTILFSTLEGVIENRYVVHEHDTWESYDATNKTYSVAPDSVLPVTEGHSERLETSWESTGYYEGNYTFSVLGYASEPLVLEECSYEALRVFTYELNLERGAMFIREIKYLPELGFGIQLANSYFGFSADNAVIVRMADS